MSNVRHAGTAEVSILLNLLISFSSMMFDFAMYRDEHGYNPCNSITDMENGISKRYDEVKAEVRALCLDPEFKDLFEAALKEHMPMWTLANCT